MKRNSSPTWIHKLKRNCLISEISLWSADLLNLYQEIKKVESRADVFHIDVSDGHFSPKLLFFPDFVYAIKKTTQIPLHIHLMVSDKILDEQIKQFIKFGADLISIHVENKNINKALSLIHKSGIASGLVLKLETPVISIEPYLQKIQWITVLGTNVGVKGCELDTNGPKKITEIKKMLKTKNLNDLVIAADGGIRKHTVPILHASGAQSVVMGSLAFNANNFDECMDWIKSFQV